MTWSDLRMLAARVTGIFRRRTMEERLEAELHTHLTLAAEENARRGMSLQEAQYAARREFGGIEQTKATYRDQRGLPFIDAFLQDLRFALRMLAKQPGFAIVAILTLALGIGATTAVFSVVDRILFRSLPYTQEQRLVSFGLTAPIERDEFMLGAGYVDFRKNPVVFESVTAMTPGSTACDVTEESPVRLSCAHVEQNFLPTLGVEPVLGRNFTSGEDQPNAPRVILISYALWKSRFAANSAVIDKTISLDNKPTRIVGVLPVSFELPTLTDADILQPLALDEAQQRRSQPGAVLRSFARLKPGIDVSQAIAGLQPFFEQSLQGAPPEFRKEIHLSVRLLRDRQVADARLASWLLLASVFSVLLVACANVTNLLLARAIARNHELAVRTALGATRGRLVRQGLTESLLLCLLGGAFGCWIAALLVRAFVSIAPGGIPHLEQAGIDLRVIAFAVVVASACALIFGTVPALPRTSPELLRAKQSHSVSRSLLRQTLAAAQIAVSVILLAGAGLLLRSLWNLQRVPTGITAQNVVTAEISLGDARYPKPEQQLAFFGELESRLRQLPGVVSLAVSDSLPPAGSMRSTIYAAIEPAGRPPLTEGTGGMVGWRGVTPEYFSALEIPIIQGRAFRQEDQQPSEYSIILNEVLARKLFPGENPIGKQLKLFRDQSPWRTVVGVAADVKNNGLTATADPEFFLPRKNEPVQSLRAAHIILRTSMNPLAVGAWIRSETVGLDSTLPVKIETMSQRVAKLAQRPRFNAVLLSLFAGVAVLLAAIGIYGVVASLVAQQTREIGVRMALGAFPQEILSMVLRSVARWAIAGASLGALGAWFSTRLLESMLFEVNARDPWLPVSALFLLVVTALLAAWIPARRAMTVDPLVALRYE